MRESVVSKFRRGGFSHNNRTCGFKFFDDGRTEILVGYLASPEGLNGESVLVEWISRQTEAKVFDLVKERADFRQTAERMLASVDEHMFP